MLDRDIKQSFHAGHAVIVVRISMSGWSHSDLDPSDSDVLKLDILLLDTEFDRLYKQFMRR